MLTKQVLDKTNYLTIVFHGGEPLLRYDFIKEYILSLTKEEKKKIAFAVQTNASLLNDEMIEFFESNEVAIGLSLDGHTDDMNLLRKPKEGGSVLYPVKKLIEKHPDFVKKRCGLISVVSKKNIKKMPEFLRWVQDCGIGIISFSPLYLSGRGEAMDDFVATAEDFLKLYADVVELIKNKEIWDLKVSNIYGYVDCLLSTKPESLCFRNPCGACGEFLVVDTYEGKIRSCDCTNDDYFKYADLEDVKLSSESNIWQKIDDSVVKEKLIKRTCWLRKNDCKACRYFYFCGGTCVGQALANLGTDLAVNKINCAINQYMFPLILKDIVQENSIFYDYFKKHVQQIEPKEQIK